MNASDIERLGCNPNIRTLQQAIEDYKSSWECTAQEASSRNVRLNNILSVLNPSIPIRQLEYRDGLYLRAQLRAKGLKVSYVRKHLQDLKRIFKLQVANRFAGFNPFSDLSAGRTPKEEIFKPRVLTEEEIAIVINKAKERPRLLAGWLHVMLLVLFGCGVRLGEAMKLRWEMIDWETRSLHLPETITKTGKARSVGIGLALYYELLMRQQPEGFIFPRQYTTSVSNTIGQHFRECGIKARPHDARHTYATMIQGVGARTDEAMQRTGHTTPAMLSHYTHPSLGRVFEDEFSFMKVPETKESSA